MSNKGILKQYLYATDLETIDKLQDVIGDRDVHSFRTMREASPMDTKYQSTIDGTEYFEDTENSVVQFPVGKAGVIMVQLTEGVDDGASKN